MSTFRKFRLLTLGAAALVLSAVPLAAATLPAPGAAAPTVTLFTQAEYAAAIEAAKSGTAEARQMLKDIFGRTDRSPEGISALAISLIGELKGDPLAMTDAATVIADVASEVMNALPILRVTPSPGFVLRPGAIGWDFGPADSPLYPGFRRITPSDLAAGEAYPHGVRLAANDDLFADGIANVNTFGATIPDGTYRVIILTADRGDLAARPLGELIRMAGRDQPIANPAVGQWHEGGHLFYSGPRLADASGGIGTASEGPSPAGATMANVDIIDGRLFIEFTADGDAAFVTGLILEPADEPSALYAPELLPGLERILLAEGGIAATIGGLLETVAAAAGDPATRARIITLPETPVQDIQTVSAN